MVGTHFITFYDFSENFRRNVQYGNLSSTGLDPNHKPSDYSEICPAVDAVYQEFLMKIKIYIGIGRFQGNVHIADSF